MNKMGKKLICCLCVLLITFCMYWIFSIIKSEYLTTTYGSCFEEYYCEYTSLEYTYLKVLNYGDDKAIVYYVERHEGGDVLYFEKDKQGRWNIVEWKTIWSRTGSASEFVWPYIR